MNQMRNRIQDQLNGNVAKFIKIVFLIFSVIALLWTSFRTYAKVDFVTTQNNQHNKVQDVRIDTISNRIEQTEKQLSVEITRAQMKDEEFENAVKDIKEDLREIKLMLRNLKN